MKFGAPFKVRVSPIAKMTTYKEALVIASNVENEIHVMDPYNGTKLYTFKNNTSTKKGLLLLPHTRSIVSVQAKKAAIQVWSWGKEAPLYKSVLAEKMGPITASHCGHYLLAGSLSGKIYVWYLPTGKLLRVWDGHYKAINCMTMTSDDGYIISGGEDAIINVWNFVDVVDKSLEEEIPRPVRTWNDHVLPVTDVVVGIGGSSGRIVSCSMDRTCKMFDIPSGERLYSVTCPSPLTCVAMDTQEQRVYMGAADGKVYIMNLMAASVSNLNARVQVETFSSTGVSLTQDPLLPRSLEGAETPISALVISDCGTRVCAASDAGVVRIYDARSGQVIQTIDTKGTVSALVLTPRPENLFGSQVNSPLVQPLRKYMNTV